MQLNTLGWSAFFKDQILNNKIYNIGRITHSQREKFIIHDGTKEIHCEFSGKFRHNIIDKDQLPVIGDWCQFSRPYTGASLRQCAFIERVLKRKTKLRRIVPGEQSDEQVLAANIDYVFIVTSANSEFNINKLERFMLLVNSSGAKPLIVLSKIDLVSSNQLQKLIDQIKENINVPILCTSVEHNIGIQELLDQLRIGMTGIFIGSSGVGKSSLINLFIGEQKCTVNQIREKDNKGRHTTTSSILYNIPGSRNIIDTPGIRELQLVGYEIQSGQFDDILILINKCKFNNCTHVNEQGCAINAIELGLLESQRFTNYKKMQRESDYNEAKLNHKKYIERKRRWMKETDQLKNLKKERKEKKWKTMISKLKTQGIQIQYFIILTIPRME